MIVELNCNVITALVVEHDMAFVCQIARQVVSCISGVICQGSIDQITENQAVQEIDWAKATMATEPLLDVRNITTGYGSTPILRGIDLAIQPGEIVAVIGRNGVGKTTMMRSRDRPAAGLAGSIKLKGQEISPPPPERRAQTGIGATSHSAADAARRHQRGSQPVSVARRHGYIACSRSDLQVALDDVAVGELVRRQLGDDVGPCPSRSSAGPSP